MMDLCRSRSNYIIYVMNITFKINMYLPGNNHTTIRVHDISLHGVFAFRGILKIRIMHCQLAFPVYKNCSTCGSKYRTLIRYRERIGTFRSSYQRNFTLDSPRTLHKIGNRNRRKQLLGRPTVPNSLAVLFVNVLEVMLSIPRCTRMAPPLPTKLMTPLQHLE